MVRHRVRITRIIAAILTLAFSAQIAGAQLASCSRMTGMHATHGSMMQHDHRADAAGAEALGDLHEVDLKGPTLLVLGSEGEGMGRSVRRSLSCTARLAQSGRIGSLNASVAAAIALYEASNQRIKT